MNINTQSEISMLKKNLETQWLKIKLISENEKPDSGEAFKTLQTIKELEGAIYFINALEVS